MRSENLVSVNTLDLCTRIIANTSYVSPNGQILIDHIIMPIETIDTKRLLNGRGKLKVHIGTPGFILA